MEQVGIEVLFAGRERYYLNYGTQITSRPFNQSMFILLNDYLTKKQIKKLVGAGRLGKITLIKINSPIYDLSYHTFYPFGHHPDINAPQLLGKGIADIVQLLISEDLIKRFGKELVICHERYKETKWRKGQIERLGIEMGKPYRLDEYVNQIRNGLIN